MKTALVAGASGIVGRHLIDRLLAEEGWRVVGVSRTPVREASNTYRHVSVDLTDPAATAEKIGDLSDVTHVFYAGRNPKPDAADEAQVNLAMLTNILDPLERTSDRLERVVLVHGMKWYGSHLGTYPVGVREDGPRHQAANFYYTQQDHVEERSARVGWSWTALRPHLVCGFSTGYPHNIAAVIAVYAAIAKELGLPLRFPGSRGCWDAINQMTDVDLLSDCLLWVAEAEAARNEAFNLINGDFFRWAEMWPKVACFFDMEAGEVGPVRMAQVMADKGPVWADMVARHGLSEPDLSRICNWAYGDGALEQDWHNVASNNKLHRAGFNRVVDSDEMLLRILQRYRDHRVIP